MRVYSRPLKKISSVYQGPHLSIRDASRQHPEAAIGMHVLDALDAEFVGGTLDSLSDQTWRFDFVVLDVDHSDSEPEFRLDVFQDR